VIEYSDELRRWIGGGLTIVSFLIGLIVARRFHAGIGGHRNGYRREKYILFHLSLFILFLTGLRVIDVIFPMIDIPYLRDIGIVLMMIGYLRLTTKVTT